MSIDRDSAATGQRDELLVARYRANYGLDTSVELTLQQVREHLELERDLTQQLRASTPEARTATFERCYNELYSELPWLAGRLRWPRQRRLLRCCLTR